jgi:hypothetical protein
MKHQRYKRAKREEARSVATQLRAQLRLESLPDGDELDRLLSLATADNKQLILDLTRISKALLVGYTVTFAPPKHRAKTTPVEFIPSNKLLNPDEVEDMFDDESID